MNQGMTIRASPIEVFDGTERLGLGWMPAGDVARIADPRHTHLEQLWITAAV